jgi:hypothetical protein
MAGVRDGLVAASCTVNVRFLMAAAVVIGRAVRRIHGRGINRVFVHVVAVNVVKVAIVKIVPVTLVPDCCMPAPEPVRMAVAVGLVGAVHNLSVAHASGLGANLAQTESTVAWLAPADPV